MGLPFSEEGSERILAAGVEGVAETIPAGSSGVDCTEVTSAKSLFKEPVVLDPEVSYRTIRSITVLVREFFTMRP